jgi:outer membrane protein
MKKLVLVFAFALITAVSMAQTPAPLKVGYADVEYIFSQMPEAKTIETELQTLRTQLKKSYDSKMAEFKAKLDEYNKYGNTVSEAIKQNSERELQQMQTNIQKFEEDSQAELQKRNAALLGPVQEKVGKAIEDVAKENGYSLIMNNQISGLDVILYGDDKLDVSDIVLKKMGITPPPQTQTPAANNTTTTPPKKP